jgi:hypothetical protein
MAHFWKCLSWVSGLGFFGWVTTYMVQWNCTRKDRNLIYTWLKANTNNEPAETHRSLFEISDCTRLSEKRVRMACLQSSRIYQSREHPGNYSIWRKEPQSVYETRGLVRVPSI